MEKSEIKILIMLRKIFIISLLLLPQGMRSQSIYLGLNPLLKEQKNGDLKSCFTLLEKYFLHYSNDMRYTYWNNLDFTKIKVPDTYLKYYGYNSYYKENQFYKPTVLDITKQSDNSYAAIISFSKCSTSEISVVSAIINVTFIKINGELKITNTLLYNLEENQWRQNIQNGIMFHVSPAVKFDNQEASELIKFNSRTADLFKFKPINFRYVACSTFEEMQRIRGIEFDLDAINGGGAQTDIENSIIYVSNGKLNYLHEVVHLYYYQSYLRTNCYSEFWNEALATYLGGSMDHPLEWHLKKIKESPQFKKYDFGDLENLKSINELESTNMSYVVGGLLCKSIFQKHKKNVLEEILLIDSMEKSYDLIKNILGVKRDELDAYIKSEINKQ